MLRRAWELEYAGRVRQTMTTYLRGGRARAVWLTLPIPSGERPFAACAVNAAGVRASAGPRGVSVLRLDEVFTPDGHRDVMPHRGPTVRTFKPDGVHLTIAGTAIAARPVAGTVRDR